MNPQYFRIRLPQAEALSRLLRWTGAREAEPAVETSSSEALEMALDGHGRWKPGAPLFVSQLGEWTLFNDFKGYFSNVPAADWLRFVGADSFHLAGYNDAIGTGELVVIEQGRVVREFWANSDDAEDDVNKGRLSSEANEPIESWVQVASLVDDDDLAFSDEGWLVRLEFGAKGE